MPQAPKPLCFILFWSWVNSLFPSLVLWGKKNWPPSMKVSKWQIFGNKRGLAGAKMPMMKVHGAKALNELELLSYSPFEEIPFPALNKRFCDLPHSHSAMSSSSHAQQLRLPLTTATRSHIHILTYDRAYKTIRKPLSWNRSCIQSSKKLSKI